MAFRISYLYDFVIKLCRQQAEVIQSREHVNVGNIGQGETQHRYIKAQTWWQSGIQPLKCLSCFYVLKLHSDFMLRSAAVGYKSVDLCYIRSC